MNVPEELLYTKEHEWIRADDDNNADADDDDDKDSD